MDEKDLQRFKEKVLKIDKFVRFYFNLGRKGKIRERKQKQLP